MCRSSQECGIGRATGIEIGAPVIEPASSDSAAVTEFEPEPSQNDGPGGDPDARALTRPGPQATVERRHRPDKMAEADTSRKA